MKLKVAAVFTGIFVLGALMSLPLHASGPIETNPYAQQGVDVDEQDVSAKLAKDKALIAVQMKAIVALGDRLGNEQVGAALGKMDQKQVMPLLKSLSIEKETITPGRYQGTFTVRFLPEKVKPLLSNLGVQLPEEQGPPMMIIPVWTDENGRMMLWEDNLWRKAWLDLNASQSQIPIIVPLGDQDDQTTLSPADITNINVVNLEAIRRRYDVKTMLIAFAQPAPGGGIHAHVVGDSPLGKVTIDKIYTADTHQLGDSAVAAAQRFQQLITDKFKADQSKLIAKAAGEPLALAVSIPFAGPSQWNGLRSRILAAPGVVSLDVTSLDPGGAAAQLLYSGHVEDLSPSFTAVGLKLDHSGSQWVVSPL